MDVAAIGLKGPELPDDEFVQYSEPKHGIYKTIVIRDGKLVFNDIRQHATVKRPARNLCELPDDRRTSSPQGETSS